MTIRERLFGARTQLSCRQVGRLLQSYLDGELDEERSQRIADHLDDCLRCGLEAETYQAVRASLERRSTVEPERLARLHDFGARLAAGDPDVTAMVRTLDAGDDPNPGDRASEP
jgi:anti-sigma factor RsiW